MIHVERRPDPSVDRHVIFNFFFYLFYLFNFFFTCLHISSWFSSAESSHFFCYIKNHFFFFFPFLGRIYDGATSFLKDIHER